jgi:predicted lipoprotein
MNVNYNETTVHLKQDISEAKVQVNHRSYGTIVRLLFDPFNSVRIFFDNRQDFANFFNVMSWEVNEEVVDGNDEESTI